MCWAVTCSGVQEVKKAQYCTAGARSPLAEPWTLSLFKEQDATWIERKEGVFLLVTPVISAEKYQ